MLPDDPRAIEPELQWALKTAEEVRRTIRATVRDLWPAELTADQFESDLRDYAADVLGAAELDLVFDIRGDFSALSPPVRRSLYRICQEGLANIVHHAGARNSRICVDVSDGRAQSIIRDDGRGFDTAAILAQPYSEDRFGLRGMRERALALGGTCRIYSQPDAGTSIVIDLPANMQAHHVPETKSSR
jgi:signal transduction histidine kinase